MTVPTMQIEIEPAGDPVTGVWCDPCATPSVVAQVMVVTIPRSTMHGIVAGQVCTGCGTQAPIR